MAFQDGNILTPEFNLKQEEAPLQVGLLSEHLLQSLIDAIPHGAFILSDELRVLMGNRSGLRWLGKAHLENSPCPFLHELFDSVEINPLLPKEKESCLTTTDPSDFSKSHKNGWDEEVELLDHSGSSHLIKLQVRPFTQGSSPIFLLSLFDLSASKRKRLMDQLFFHDIANTTSELLCNCEQLASPIHNRHLAGSTR